MDLCNLHPPKSICAVLGSCTLQIKRIISTQAVAQTYDQSTLNARSGTINNSQNAQMGNHPKNVSHSTVVINLSNANTIEEVDCFDFDCYIV